MQTDDRPSYYAGLRFRMIVVVALVSLTPMGLVSGIILYQFSSYSHQMVHAHLGELVLKHRQDIESFIMQRLSDISHLSKSFGFEQLRQSEFLQQRLWTLQEEYGFVFVDIGLIDAEGRQEAYAGPFELSRADYSRAEWFHKALRSPTYISDVFLGLRGHPHFIVAVRRHWRDSAWILRATIDFAAFNTLVETLSVGKTGTAFILNREGEFQTRPPKGEMKLTKEQYMNLFRKSDEALLAREQAGGRELEAQDVGGFLDDPLEESRVFTFKKGGQYGGKFIIVASFLKSNEWLLIFQQEHSDAYSKLKRTQITAGFISLLGGLSIIFMAVVVSNRMVKRIARLRTEKEMMSQQIIETGKLASVGELAAGIAHEINNPVAIMVEEAGWIQDLLGEGIEDGRNVDEFKRALRQIETQGHRCKEITHKLLSFARRTDARVQTVQLNDVITEVVDLLSQKSRYANVEAEVFLQPDLPTIQASLTEMQQVLMNLVHNAVDAMEKTGGKIHIRTDADADEVRISITDTGPGIPESNLGRIFDPFFTTKPVGKGTGLGLSICYGIVNKMRGRIDVESQVGKGTTFRIVLPLKEQAGRKHP